MKDRKPSQLESETLLRWMIRLELKKVNQIRSKELKTTQDKQALSTHYLNRRLDVDEIRAE